jgi:hypothetical protein
LQFRANYTWSKQLDDLGWVSPFNRHFDYGPARDDLRHNFRFSNVWEIPKLPVNHLAGKLIAVDTPGVTNVSDRADIGAGARAIADAFLIVGGVELRSVVLRRRQAARQKQRGRQNCKRYRLHPPLPCWPSSLAEDNTAQ